LNTIKLFSFLFVLLMPVGCVLQSVSNPAEQVLPSSVVAEPQIEETDFECSYFYFLWGRYAELSARFEEALEAYEKALICDQTADYIARKLPILLLRLNRDNEARSRLLEYLQRHPQASGVRLLLAKIFIRQGSYDRAAEQYQTIHRQNPDEIQALLLLGELYLARGQYDSARKVLLQVLDISKEEYSAHVLLARIYSQEKQAARARDHYQTALDLNWSMALELELGDMYLQNKKFIEAEAQFKKLVDRENSSEEASIALIHVYLVQNKEEAALRELDRLKTLSEHPEHVELTIARIYAKRKEYKKATDILQELLQRKELPQARYLLGIIYYQQKKYEQALVQLQQISVNAESYEDSVFFQVRLLRLLERPGDAIEVLDNVLKDGKEHNVDLYVLLATLYQVQGKVEQGETTFDTALLKFPDNASLLYEYGLFLEQAGKHQQALSVMEKVLVLQPEHAAALNYVGYTWADSRKHLDKALKYIRRAVELEPENGYIRDSLGWVHFRLGHLDQAQQELEKANTLSPDDPAILEHLGDVYLESGQLQRALQVYRKALGFYTEELEKTGVREKIRIIEEQGAQ
jgi:tetratricopeptide (TPR) repeat protein